MSNSKTKAGAFAIGFRRARISDDSGLWSGANRVDFPHRWQSRLGWLAQQYEDKCPTPPNYNAQPWAQLIQVYRQRGEHSNANGIAAHQHALETQLMARQLTPWMQLGLTLGTAAITMISLINTAFLTGAGLGCVILLLTTAYFVFSQKLQRFYMAFQFIALQMFALIIVLLFFAMFRAADLSVRFEMPRYFLVWTIGFLSLLLGGFQVGLLKIDASTYVFSVVFIALVSILFVIVPVDALRPWWSGPAVIIEIETYVSWFTQHRYTAGLASSLMASALFMFLARPVVYLVDFLYWAGFRYALSPARAIITILVCLFAGSIGTNYVLERGFLVIDADYAATLVDPYSITVLDPPADEEAAIGGDDVITIYDFAFRERESGALSPAIIPCKGHVSSMLYAADLFIPIINLRQEMRCHIVSPKMAQGTYADPRDVRESILSSSSGSFWLWIKSLYRVLGWIVMSMTVVTFITTLRRTMGQPVEYA